MTEITLSHITKIEGHAALHVKIDKGKLKTCRLTAVEGSRYFEGLVKGRNYHEAPEMTSRICGICSCAHTIAAQKAVERALDVHVTDQTKRLRKILTLGERIRSHATHLHFLALPDYLGKASGLDLLPKYQKEIERALRLMHFGNKVVHVIGGREIHPVAAQVGGFTNIPDPQKVAELLEEAKKLIPDTIKAAQLFLKLKTPNIQQGFDWFSLTNPEEYAVLEGDLKSSKKTYTQEHYLDYIEEYHTRDSTANFVVKDGKSFMVGALARFNNNRHQLMPKALALMKHSPLKDISTNPFHQNIAQAIETVHSMEDIVELLKEPFKEEKRILPTQHSGHGIAAIEVPRGILWHEYRIQKGKIVYCNIITPTAQNLLLMNENLKGYIPTVLDLPKEEIISNIEKLRTLERNFQLSSYCNWKLC